MNKVTLYVAYAEARYVLRSFIVKIFIKCERKMRGKYSFVSCLANSFDSDRAICRDALTRTFECDIDAATYEKFMPSKPKCREISFHCHKPQRS